MNQIIKRISMFCTFFFLLTITSSCEDFEFASITPTIAQKVTGLKVELKGDDAVLTWANPANVKGIVILHTDGTGEVESAATTWSYGIIDVNKDYFFTVKTKDADGNEYQTVDIGSQTLLVGNLKTTKYNDGSSIPLGISDANFIARLLIAFFVVPR